MGVSQSSRSGAQPAMTAVTGASVTSTCATGRKPSRTIAARVDTGTSKARSADDATGITVLHTIDGLPRSAPHLYVVRGQEASLVILFLSDLRQMHPRHCRMPVMCEVPVVMQPQ